MPKISVIIPVYNAEQHLSKCLDSVLNQTFQDFEVICVNDGSTDNSLEILNSYAKKDEKFKIISIENQGVSIARNVGIENTRGEYLQFVDADDWIEPECLEYAYNKIVETNSDIVFFSCRHFSLEEDKITFDDLKFTELYLKNHNKKSLTEFMWTCWNKIYKKSFITNNNIRFEKDISYGEDGIFNMMCLYNHPKIEGLPIILYNYTFNNKSSITYNVSSIDLECKTLNFLINKEEFKKAEDELKIFSINRFCIGIFSWYNYYSDNKKDINKRVLYDLIKTLKLKVDKNILMQSHGYIELKNEIKRPLIKKLLGIKKIFKK